MQIDGRTRLYAIIADPIEQVKTPELINAILHSQGLNAVLVPLHVGASDLDTCLQGLRRTRNFGGMVVTVPHKQTAASLCDEISDQARLVGAVNVIRRAPDGRLTGDILDGKGFVSGLRQHGIDPAGASVFMAGAGGAASAIAFALAEAGINRLGIHNRSATRAQALVERIQVAFPELAVQVEGTSARGFDLVINATSLGMQADDPLPLDVDQLHPSQTVAEIIMQPETTALLKAASDRGCRIQFGLPMLQAQVQMMVQFLSEGHSIESV